MKPMAVCPRSSLVWPGGGIDYVVDVPKSVCGWTKQPYPTVPERTAPTGRPPSKPRLDTRAKRARRVDQLWKRGGPSWQRFHVKNTDKGPLVWDARVVRFYPSEDKLPGEECWLIVARNVLSDELKYFLSNAPKETPAEVLLHVAFSRWHIERVFEDGKGQVGLDHFEVRGYLPLMRHLILSMVSFLFLVQQTQRLRKKNPQWSVRQVRVALEAQLDPNMGPRERTRLLRRVAKKIEYWQHQADKAARSHHKQRCRQLRARGTFISKLPKCYHVF